MSRTLAYVIVLLVAGFALISLSRGNTLEKLSNLGLGLLAAAIVMATQLQRNELTIIQMDNFRGTAYNYSSLYHLESDRIGQTACSLADLSPKNYSRYKEAIF